MPLQISKPPPEQNGKPWTQNAGGGSKNFLGEIPGGVVYAFEDVSTGKIVATEFPGGEFGRTHLAHSEGARGIYQQPGQVNTTSELAPAVFFNKYPQLAS